MTWDEIAAQINTLFRDYGLDHDVVEVASQGTFQALDRVSAVPLNEGLSFIDRDNRDAMELLLVTLKFVFQRFHEVEPVSGQLRLF